MNGFTDAHRHHGVLRIPPNLADAKPEYRGLRVRWLMVTGYTAAAVLCLFASRAFWAEQWVAFAVLFFAVIALGYLLSAGRRR